RFLHFVRTLAPMVAGAADMHYGTFLFYNIFGGLFWAISVSALGYWLGNTIPDIDRYILPILGVIGLLALSPTLMHLLPSAGTQRPTRELSRAVVGRDRWLIFFFLSLVTRTLLVHTFFPKAPR